MVLKPSNTHHPTWASQEVLKEDFYHYHQPAPRCFTATACKDVGSYISTKLMRGFLRKRIGSVPKRADAMFVSPELLRRPVRTRHDGEARGSEFPLATSLRMFDDQLLLSQHELERGSFLLPFPWSLGTAAFFSEPNSFSHRYQSDRKSTRLNSSHWE